jgi:peroxiredoxin
MKTRVLVLAIVLFAVLFVGQHFAIKEQPDLVEIDQFVRENAANRAWPGKTAPDFELDTVNGEKFRLSEVVGRKVILVNFFATWCQPCRHEMPELARFSASMDATQPWLVVFVDAGEEAPPVKKFVQDLQITFPVGIDHAQRIQRLYGVTSYPTNVLIGADGRVQIFEPGAIRNADVTLRPAVEAELKKIREGKGIRKEDYVEAAARENYHPVRPVPERRTETLTGRALTIAEKMDCLCGCSKKVEVCGCNNAGKIKKALRSRTFGDESDADVMREMGKQFCMDPM